MPSSNSLLPLIKTAGAGFVGGLLIYGVGDVLGEYTTFFQLQDKAMILANRSQELKDQIGHPFTAGPWYNARIGFTAGGHLAQCTFQLQGTKQITDVTVRGLRGAGLASRALYNIFDGHWTIVDCTAMFPAGGGLVEPRSLLPTQAPGKAEAATALPVSTSTSPLGSTSSQGSGGKNNSRKPETQAAPNAAKAGHSSNISGTQQQAGWPWFRGGVSRPTLSPTAEPGTPADAQTVGR